MLLRDLTPFGLALGGVDVALAYVNDDPYADIIVGSGPGLPATVKVFSGLTGNQLATPKGQYAPFGAALGGVYVAASNDPLPTATYVSIDSYFSHNVGEGEPIDIFGVVHSGPPGALTAYLSFGVDGAGDPLATWNTDYVMTASLTGGSSAILSASGATLTFGASSSEIELDIWPILDNIPEGVEGFRVTVLPDPNTPTHYQAAAPSTLDVQIGDAPALEGPRWRPPKARRSAAPSPRSSAAFTELPT